MREADMQTLFRKHIQTRFPSSSEVYELKICKGSSLPFSALQKHQELALVNAETTGLFHKLTDPPIFYGGKTRFNAPRPFDCMALVQVKAFVVIWFYKPRAKKIAIKIPIQNFITEREQSSRKSLTEARAHAIGELIML